MVVYDSDRLSALLRPLGVHVEAARIEATQPLIRHELSQSAWAFGRHGEARARGEDFFRRVLEAAGAEPVRIGLEAAATHVWDEHLRDNLWTRVFPGVHEALALLKQAGLRLGVISNAEGTIRALLERIGVLDAFELVLDSAIVGVAKPDPRIFEMALQGLAVAPDRAVMVGDSVAADVKGAWGAGVPAALIDPFDVHPLCQAPRFADLLAFAQALISAK
jgi:HAD superfamily hydrolase (TIGR01509 family)